MSDSFSIIGVKASKGSLWQCSDELCGGSRFKALPERDEATNKVNLSPEAFAALKRLRAPGETVREALERIIYAAPASEPGQG